MGFKTLAILATLGLSAAQTSVVSLFIYDADPQPLVASIIAEGSGTTTYSINCPSGTDSDSCGMGPGLYYTHGPSTIEMSMSEPTEGFWEHVVCTTKGTTTAICTEIASGTGANSPGTATEDIPKSEITLFPVTVTAGPSAGASLATTATQTTQSSNTDSSDSTASQTSDKSSSQTSGKSSASVTSGTSTGGLPMITGSPGLTLGGAAIVLMAAAL